MGCIRPSIIDGFFPVDNKAVDLVQIPDKACDGQMTFRNTGTTKIHLRFGQQKGASQSVGANAASIVLKADEAFSDSGMTPGWVLAWSDANGGQVCVYVSYRQS